MSQDHIIVRTTTVNNCNITIYRDDLASSDQYYAQINVPTNFPQDHYTYRKPTLEAALKAATIYAKRQRTSGMQ